MLQLVILPSASTIGVPAKLTVIDEASHSLRSTLHGLKSSASQRAARRVSMLRSDEPRRPLLDDFEESYAKDVLGLEHGKAEGALDERLRVEAKELGDVQSVSDDTTKAHSSNSVTSDTVRRSESIGSRASRSTGLTSNFSDVSKDLHNNSVGGKPRASLSFRDYDAFLSRGHTNGDRKSLSFSPPPTPTRSSLSLTLTGPDPEASPRKHFRRLRGLSMLKLHRTSSAGSVNADRCPHCPQDASSQRRAIHKLPCGHRLCTQALRNTIMAGTQSKNGAVPSCCGNPIPGRVVEQVMTQEEQNALLNKLEQWDEAISISTSTTSEVRDPVRTRTGVITEGSRTVSTESKVNSPSPGHRRELEKAMDLPEYKALRQQQESQRNRFQIWAAKAQESLEAHHVRTRASLRERHDLALEDVADRQAADVSDAEDKQVKAEADMRTAHDQEVRDNATALKHMEAYCAGIFSTTGKLHNRTVTEQERSELEKTRRMRDGMGPKHDSAINVLRGEQGRRMRMRMQRQEKETTQLENKQKKEEEEAEKECSIQMVEWAELVSEKRARMIARWEMQNAIFLKKLEADTGVTLNGRLPGIEWRTEERRARRSKCGLAQAGSGAARARTDSRLMEG